jgi:hypothetical protein
MIRLVCVHRDCIVSFFFAAIDIICYCKNN